MGDYVTVPLNDRERMSGVRPRRVSGIRGYGTVSGDFLCIIIFFFFI